MKDNNTLKIGFIGQGFVGKAYADDFEARGFSVVRYALEEPYVRNKEQISECDIVFISVPTPTVPEDNGQSEDVVLSVRFDYSAVLSTISLVGVGKIALIKSTLLPGTTEKIQREFPDRIILFSPEFLRARFAKEEAANPLMNVIGMSIDDEVHREAAEKVMNMLPKSAHQQICSSTEAEIVKYTHNCRAYAKIVMANVFYDIAQKLGCNWEEVLSAMNADPWFSNMYNDPVHSGKRGVGGYCFIKDFAAFREFYESTVGDDAGASMLSAIEKKNLELLRKSGKDKELLEGVYGSLLKNDY
jgi:UDP-glucose 6-dehydrogenase